MKSQRSKQRPCVPMVGQKISRRVPTSSKALEDHPVRACVAHEADADNIGQGGIGAAEQFELKILVTAVRKGWSRHRPNGKACGIQSHTGGVCCEDWREV